MSGGGTTSNGSAAGLTSSTKINGSVSTPASSSTTTTTSSSGNNSSTLQNGSAGAGKKAKGGTSSTAVATTEAKNREGCLSVSGSTNLPPSTSENGKALRSSTEATAGVRPTTSAKSAIETTRPSSSESTEALHSPAVAPPPAHEPPKAFATTLLNLEVKVLTQALGAENQWEEQGDGRVAFCDFTIRVVAPRVGKEEVQKAEGQVSSAVSSAAAAAAAAADESTLSNTVSVFDEEDVDGEVVVLEDTISNDTPFVGENCCIVWNSFEKQLSLCLMYASEEGYSASWSALVALQDKSYPPYRFDLLERCRPSSGQAQPVPDDSRSSVTPPTAATNKTEEVVLPYSYFIHTKYDPPLGFIEQHALSLSIMEHGHATNPALYSDKETLLTMLNVASADLLDSLLSEDTFTLLLNGLQCTLAPPLWSVPEPLRMLHVPEEVATFIRKDRYIGFLQESVFPRCGTSDSVAELIGKFSSMSRRMRNEIVCALLTCDSTFSEACEALRVVPGAMIGGSSGLNRASSMEISSNATSVISDEHSSTGAVGNITPSRIATPPMPDTIQLPQKAEQQVLAHLRFLRELVSLSIAELGRDMVGPIVGKVFQSGLLEPLSLVAERFAMPSGTATVFLKYLMSAKDSGQHGARRSGGSGVSLSSNCGTGGVSGPNANYYSHAVEEELSALLDATLVRLNERQEEQLMNEHVRMPILADPVRYNGIVTFMLRQLVTGGAIGTAFSASSASTGPSVTRSPGCPSSPSRRILRDSMSASNPYALFHVLGLHDDEGSAASERTLDSENTDIRNRFHSFIITKYLTHATRGLMAPVPLPPALGGVCVPSRGTLISNFNSPNACQNGGRPHVSQDGNEGHTGCAAVGVPNTAPGAGGGGTSGVNVPFGGSGTVSPVLPLPQGITSALIRVLEYMVILASNANRELILRTVFHHKSHILHFTEGVCDILCGANGSGARCQVGLDVLCSCVRFLKVIVMQMTAATEDPDNHPLPSYVSSREPLPSPLLTTICRQLTVERDTFGYLLKAYNRLGGLRRSSLFHSSLLAVLDMISKCSARGSADSVTNNLRDVRDYLFFKHLQGLPEVFACRYREALLSEVTLRLGHEATHSPNDSISILSSTAGSELTRSSSKLRFVDEVEAVSGVAEGTVILGTVLNPAIVASMTNTEERQRKRNGRSSIEQWNMTANHVMGLQTLTRSAAPLSFSDDHGGRVSPSSSSPKRASPSLTIHVTRPPNNTSSSGSSAVSPRASAADALKMSALPLIGSSPKSDGHLGPASHSGQAESTVNQTDTGLRPTAPREGRPPGRPRSFASVLETSSRTAASACGEQRSQGSTPNVTAGGATALSSQEEMLSVKSDKGCASQSPELTNTASSLPNENLILPKVKKRLPSGGKRT